MLMPTSIWTNTGGNWRMNRAWTAHEKNRIRAQIWACARPRFHHNSVPQHAMDSCLHAFVHLRCYPHSDLVSIFTYDWAPNSDALHFRRVSTMWFLHRYLHAIELVMHFTLRGYPQSDFVFILTIELRTVMHLNLTIRAGPPTWRLLIICHESA